MKANARTFALATILAVAVPTLVASAQGSDPVIGTWALNAAKSTYTSGSAPKSATRVYTAAGQGYKFSATTVAADGKSSGVEFTVAYDGKYVAVTGSADVDSIMVKRIDANTVEATQTKAGKVVVKTTRVISADGKTLTSTATGTDAAGKAWKNVEVFDKK
jgi:WD40 repeat protein